MLIDRHTDRQTDGRTDRQTDRQTDGQAGRQTDGRTDMKLIVVFCNFANAPKNSYSVLNTFALECCHVLVTALNRSFKAYLQLQLPYLCFG